MACMDREIVDGKPYVWIGAFVYSHEKDENIFVGALRFHGEKLVLSRNLANFVEIYGTRKPVSEIPQVVVTFGNLKVNGKAVEKPTATRDLSAGCRITPRRSPRITRSSSQSANR